MTEADLRSVLDPVIFSDLHIELFMQRRSEILEQAEHARLVP